MTRKFGGDSARRGLYFDVVKWKFFFIDSEGTLLPGTPDQVYLQLNIFELVIMAAIIAGTYVLFLPFVGLAMVGFAAVVTVFVFFVQKIMCKALRKLCQVEHWLCDITHRYFCKQCGVDCDDDLTMVVKAFMFSIFLLLGIIVGKYLL